MHFETYEELKDWIEKHPEPLEGDAND